eukprot:CAMPEP_0183329042 /NCGR_PEP_ID=MMETSP0160_2-20130417/84590_1 /TAXON_ID=2839 ORGANISM="Odontella Sinensis, Strain Grunow 1884" /NCGR_SAMPLE_ID=MMETSP0160_2 /ASSEMBLY_ACC=CAM_ASM_000250 /LENGTH=62 /DNA_ID=CAMNT_0025497219 /DNA_START=382 /DNA_END=570 /DNA_ORIENTATION=+
MPSPLPRGVTFAPLFTSLPTSTPQCLCWRPSTPPGIPSAQAASELPGTPSSHLLPLMASGSS